VSQGELDRPVKCGSLSASTARWPNLALDAVRKVFQRVGERIDDVA